MSAQIIDLTADYSSKVPDQNKENEISLKSVKPLLAISSPAHANVRQAPIRLKRW